MANLNYYLGKAMNWCGYSIVRKYRYPQSTLNPLQFGIHFLSQRNKDLSIVQVGAFDGELSDPLKVVLTERQCSALLVEPQPLAFKSLTNRYAGQKNIVLENSAISETDGKIKMYLPECEDLSPIASIDRKHLEKFGSRTTNIREIEVQSLSAKSLLKKHDITSVDILQVDTEGHDYKILSQFFRSGLQPLLINLETLHLEQDEREALRQDLTHRGYQFIEYGIDIFAIHESTLTS